ncbi:MAG: ATP-binding protein [Gammaproteobacteria bacterium]|nr:ATP-binding protein [Gammaproteobacteria bacterium]
MKREQVLQVLYDLALVTGGETRVEPLVTKTLQRLLYHTPFSSGVFFSDIARPETDTKNPPPYILARLQFAIGGGAVRNKIGQHLELPIELLCGEAGVFEDSTTIQSVFGKETHYSAGLRLPVDEHHTILLFSRESPKLEVRLDRVLSPVMQNFRKTLHLCLENERFTDALKAELETRHRLEEELIKKEKFAVVGQLTATVNHELRNPLGAMTTAIYALRRKDAKTGHHLKKLLDILDRNAFRCNQIIDEMLDYTRQPELNLNTVALDTWLDDVIEQYHVDETINVKRDTQLPPEYLVNIDEERLRRAIINVLDNGSHAIRENKDEHSLRQLTINTRLSGQRVEIIIEDSGCGIAPEVLPRIFEPLFSTRSFGVGLGMPTIKNILVQHGGNIEIASTLGQGSTVTLWIPQEEVQDTALPRVSSA